MAVYCWNTAPIDETDILRSLIAIGHPFPSPTNGTFNEDSPKVPKSTNRNAHLDHFHSISQSLDLQRAIIKDINADHRNAHRLMAASHKAQWTFQLGGLVVVRIQPSSPSSKSKDKPITLKFVNQVRGPFKVVAKLNNNSYTVHCVLRSGQYGVKRKESCAQMELLPDFIMLHRPVAFTDVNHVANNQAPLLSPILDALGIHGYSAAFIHDWRPKNRHRPPKPNPCYESLLDSWPGIKEQLVSLNKAIDEPNLTIPTTPIKRSLPLPNLHNLLYGIK